MGERAGLNGGVRTACVQGKGREERKGWERSVGAREWLEMGGEKKPLEISELGCADGCGREMGAENCADGCRRRGCNGVAGNGWGEEAAGDERAWLRGRLRTSGWKWGRRSRWRSASLAARTAADGKWVGRIARTAADGVGARELLEMGGEKKPLRDQRAWLRCGQEMGAENCADGVGATEWLEMGGEKKPLGMSELGCVDGCGREMGAENCADGWGRKVQRSGWKWVGSEGDERAWLRGRLRTANGWGELRGRLRVQGSGWKWVGRRSRWRSASLAARKAADGKWVRRIARTAADGVGAREWLEMGGEKKPLEISELGCADGCGREMGAENCADDCRRRGCNGVAGNGWGEEAAGDERAWLRGRLRTGNGCGELRGRLRTSWVQRSGWKWVGRRSRW